jgi:hypothetical protein
MARASGVLGAAGCGLICASAIAWGISVMLGPRGERSLDDAIGVWALLGLSPVLVLGLGVAIHAIVDAIRGATGRPAAKLGSLCVFLALLGCAPLCDADRSATLLWIPAFFAVLAALNLGAWLGLRRARA